MGETYLLFFGIFVTLLFGIGIAYTLWEFKNMPDSKSVTDRHKEGLEIKSDQE